VVVSGGVSSGTPNDTEHARCVGDVEIQTSEGDAVDYFARVRVENFVGEVVLIRRPDRPDWFLSECVEWTAEIVGLVEDCPEWTG